MLIPFRDRNPSKRRPYVTHGLIAVNVLVFLSYWPLFNDDYAIRNFYFEWALIPLAVVNGEHLTGLATSMFLHDGIAHILFNMLALHIFGDNVEDALGRFPFLLFYLACGIASAIAHTAVNPHSMVPTIGASGAVAGVMGGYVVLFPKARIDIFVFLLIVFRVFSLSAWIVLGVWMLIQLHGAADNDGHSSIAYWAHIAGFAAGAVLIVPVWIRRRRARIRTSPAVRNGQTVSKAKHSTQIPVIRRNR